MTFDIAALFVMGVDVDSQGYEASPFYDAWENLHRLCLLERGVVLFWYVRITLVVTYSKCALLHFHSVDAVDD